MLIIGTKFLSMTKNYDKSVKINHSPGWPYIPDYPYRFLIIGGQDQAKLMCY